jgi:nucleotidyltransferase/DNA polymerase involved in DNA repair
MNILQDAVHWLFLDLNAFFASCEQQENPALRGKPVIVVQTLTDSACARVGNVKNNDPSLIEAVTAS